MRGHWPLRYVQAPINNRTIIRRAWKLKSADWTVWVWPMKGGSNTPWQTWVTGSEEDNPSKDNKYASFQCEIWQSWTLVFQAILLPTIPSCLGGPVCPATSMRWFFSTARRLQTLMAFGTSQTKPSRTHPNRAFLKNNYATLKRLNPDTPLSVRNYETVDKAMIMCRYGMTYYALSDWQS